MKGAENIELIGIEKLIPYAKNSRTHSEEQVAQLAGSIKEFGFNNPVLIGQDDVIIAGHGRVMAARKVGLMEVPCIRLKHLTETQRKAYIIADNRLALNAGWDNELLTIELNDLLADNFALDILGFDTDELKNLLDPVKPTEGLTDEDAVPETPEEPKTKPGDIYRLGKHRLMCGDSTSIDAVEKLMDGQKVDMVFTDPPYGMRLDADYSKMPGTSTKYENVIGDHEDFDAQDIFGVIDAPIYYLWGADYYSETIPYYKDGSYFVWSKAQSEKENSVLGSRFELCWRYPKRKKEVWFIRGINQSSERLGVHPTQKPTELAVRAIELETKQGAVIVDLFGGSGSTLIACEKINRNCCMMELDPKYCDVIVKRWEDFTGLQAELV
jgi:DNA modification methylase